jgi:hypothetical protein
MFCPSPLLMHSFCMQHQVIGCASLAAIDNITSKTRTIRSSADGEERLPASVPGAGPGRMDATACPRGRTPLAKPLW